MRQEIANEIIKPFKEIKGSAVYKFMYEQIDKGLTALLETSKMDEDESKRVVAEGVAMLEQLVNMYYPVVIANMCVVEENCKEIAKVCVNYTSWEHASIRINTWIIYILTRIDADVTALSVNGFPSILKNESAATSLFHVYAAEIKAITSKVVNVPENVTIH